MADSVRRRLGAGAAAWLFGAAVFVAVAHPQGCPTPTRQDALAAVAGGARWLAANQAGDGSFLYEYDRETRTESAGYVVARHAGTLLALEQAARAGVAGAADTAEAGIGWAVGRLRSLDGGRAALGPDTGSTALLVTALVERRRAGVLEPGDDQLLDSLGQFLVSAVEDDGAVVAAWDLPVDEPVAGSRSPFFTGEVLYALSELAVELPDGGYAEPARRVARYVATRRDDAERRFPPVSDHWTAYGLAELAAWPGALGPGLTAADLAYADRQAGLFGLQSRFEAQRRAHGIARITRGPVALPSGIGTVGEGLGGIWRLTGRRAVPGVDRAVVADRLRCVAGLIVARQARSDDPKVDGAWFRLGSTRVDDQQHSMSALLAALPLLGDRS